jgi:hypothetical protein
MNKILNLTKDDFLIIWGGVKVSRKETPKGLKHISKYVQKNLNTNIVLNLPKRKDLVDQSCVNNV